MILSTIILCCTLMILWSATMFVFLFSDKPVFSVTVVNTGRPAKIVLRQSAKQVFV
jgi:hypothetical protein